MSEELLPCPFCGEEAFAHRTAYGHAVSCSECGACPRQSSCNRPDATDAARFWNTRTPSPALAEKDAVIERLRVANGILEDALQEAGDDYPGSSMQQWCVQQIACAYQALADLDGAR